jgi:hypothetical protein
VHAGSAIGDLLGEDGEVVPYRNLYRCLDKLVEHKDGMFTFLKQRWQDLFNVEFDVLPYDLTSTYFECDPPESGKRLFGYRRDKRSDCVQVIIALVVTTERVSPLLRSDGWKYQRSNHAPAIPRQD